MQARAIMTTLQDILRAKGHDVWTISPEVTVYEALSLMAAKNVGALVVLDGSRVVGIISERDYARNVILQGKSSRDTPVKDIMTSPVYYVHPDQTPWECMALMTDKRIRHLPVLVDDRLVGVISIGDIVKAIIEEQKSVIRQYEEYITGRY
jgi:CBS domain-containing protein